jgi:hypothetical protein
LQVFGKLCDLKGNARAESTQNAQRKENGQND